MFLVLIISSLYIRSKGGERSGKEANAQFFSGANKEYVFLSKFVEFHPIPRCWANWTENQFYEKLSQKKAICAMGP
jgi:hypothetical protein